MKRFGTILLVGVAVLLLVPAFMRSSPSSQLGPGVVVMTPHNEQIRFELGSRFSQWHQREFGTDAHVAWSTPGGTSEIRKLLQSQWKAAAGAGIPFGGDIDLVFGGGSYEHGVLAKPTEADDPESTISVPHGFTPEELSAWFPTDTIADGRLYDEDSFWIGTALSSFGLIWNEDEFAQRELPRPTDWSMLAHPKLRGRVAFVNPAMSGSVTTALQSILEHLGWKRGWALIRRAAANARSVSGSSTRVPGDVGAGEAAIGPCIDFYGRAQVAALEAAGITGRIQYRDAAGQTVVDADPISLLRGAPRTQNWPSVLFAFVLRPKPSLFGSCRPAILTAPRGLRFVGCRSGPRSTSNLETGCSIRSTLFQKRRPRRIPIARPDPSLSRCSCLWPWTTAAHCVKHGRPLLSTRPTHPLMRW